MIPALHWFRRDLRLTDNPALAAAAARVPAVIPVYILSHWQGRHRWTGPHRQEFLCGCLASLAQNLHAIGGRLIIRQGDAVEELARIVHETRAGAIYFNRDPDPFGRATEQKLFALGRDLGIEIVDHQGRLRPRARRSPHRTRDAFPRLHPLRQRLGQTPQARTQGTPPPSPDARQNPLPAPSVA